MGGVDLEAIKELPGYRIIMKAVLRHQIQHLVEQLSQTTGEESVMLTMSVTDGSLCHLGSVSGKSFLDRNEEFKSLFQDFILKTHDTKNTEKQFTSELGRKSTTQLSIALGNYDESTNTGVDCHLEAPERIPEPSVTPCRSAGKGNKKLHPHPDNSLGETNTLISPVRIRSPSKSKNEEDDIDDLVDSEQEHEESAFLTPRGLDGEETPLKSMEEMVNNVEAPEQNKEKLVVPLSSHKRIRSTSKSKNKEDDIDDLVDSEQNHEESASLTPLGLDVEETPLKNMEELVKNMEAPDQSMEKLVVPVSSPVLAVPELENDDLFQTKGLDDSFRAISEASGTMEECRSDSFVVIKKEIDSDFEDDSDLEPGTKRQRMSSGSGPETSLLNESEQMQMPESQLEKNDPPYPCCYCNKFFISTYKLETHERIHTGEKPYICDVCGKLFAQKSNLRTHCNIHSRDKPYFCEVCGKSFGNKSNLNRHQKIHERAKPNLFFRSRNYSSDKWYMCGICGKVFVNAFNRNRHEKIHAKDNSEWCSRINIHSTDKTWACEICGELFVNSKNRDKHLIIHTRDDL